MTAASVSDILASPVLGFLDGIEVSLFLLILGGCLGIINKLGALDAGIAALVRRLHGRETVLIAVIMAIFALLGSTYGFCEETIPFYGLLAATMFAAGFDTMVAAATVLLGAGVGCLGSTVNPFACGVATDSLASVGIEVNQGIVIALGAILTVVSYAISLFFILRYANRVRRDKGSTILSLQERHAAEEAYGEGCLLYTSSNAIAACSPCSGSASPSRCCSRPYPRCSRSWCLTTSGAPPRSRPSPRSRSRSA